MAQSFERQGTILKTNVKIFAAAIVVFATASAQAWVPIAEGGGTQTYLDETSVVKRDGYLFAVSVNNNSKPYLLKRAGYKKSILFETLYDCQGKRFKNLNTIWYSEDFGSGEGHTSYSATPMWIGPDKPNLYDTSRMTVILKKLCGTQ